MTTSHPTVSVLVTVYNRAPYLSACLDSILASTWQDFEVIIVDDCSSDNSYDIAKSYLARDARIRLYKNDKNLGDYNNRNRAAGLAEGKYLKYLDSDDLIYSHGLSVMVEAMEQYPEAAFGLSHWSRNPPEPYPIQYSPPELYKSHFLGKSPLGVGPSASIIRRECFDAVGGFSGKPFVGDSELWLKLADRWPLISFPPALVWWRQHDQQQRRLGLSMHQTMTSRYVIELESLARTKHLTDRQKTKARDYLAHLHARRIWSLALKNKEVASALSLFKAAELSAWDLVRGLIRPPPR